MKQFWKTRLLAGGAACALACVLGDGAGAYAQAPLPATAPPAAAAGGQTLSRVNGKDRASTVVPTAPASAAPVNPADVNSDQLLGDKGFYMEADTVIRDDEHHLWTAKGSVEARYQGRVLRADEIVYNQDNGVVTARGNVQLVNLDGTIEFANSMTADKDFKAGISLGFSTRQQQNAKIAADEAVRLNQDAMELNKAVFTVCDICAADGTPEDPTWSMQAAEVVQDHKRAIVYYKHVVIRIRGIPVAYSPVFWHVDPSAKRGSGLLAPKIAIDGKRGFSYEQPYLFVLSPYADLTLSPQINTKVNPFLEGEYRERFYTGEVDARFGFTYDNQFDSHGQKYDSASARTYILAQGAFAPTVNWTYGFSAERVSDPLLFQRYAVPNVFDQRGLMATDDQRLISQAYAVEQDKKSYLSISAMSFQGLAPADQNGVFPIVAPLIEGRYEPDWLLLGGRVRLEGGGVVLERSRDVITDTAPGEDSRRASIGGDWRTAYTLYDGIRVEPFANARGDFYSIDDLSNSDTAIHNTGRVLGTVGVDASWPFFRRSGDTTVVLEPLVQLAASPRATNNPYIPNEDSQVITLDETTLFEANKSQGFDYYEGGLRANVGGRATIRLDDGPEAQIVLGRSLRTTPDPTLPATTSLNQTASDWVVAASGSFNQAFSAFARTLLDSQSGQIRHLEAGFNGAIPRANGFFRYYYDAVDPAIPPTRNVQFGGQVLITQRWGMVGSANWDLIAKVPVQEEIGLLYQDECTHWELVYQHDGTYDRTLRPSDKVLVRLTLATLGGAGYQRPDFR